MSTKLANRLALKHDPISITLIGAGHSSTPVRKSVRAKISSRTSPYELNADFLIVDNLIGDLPAHDVRTDEWQIPPNFILADPQFNKSAPLDLILGARHYHEFFQSGAQYRIAIHLPVLMESMFGWIVSGSASIPNINNDTSYASSVACMSTLDETLERFWKMEELHVRDGLSPEERYCENLYLDTTQRDDTGRYIVRLPKKSDFKEKLGLSKSSALRRFTMLERRLERDPRIKAAYHEFMREYLELGHMSLLRAPDDDESAYYLPHHPVFKASSSTTKTRVVFDGSAKTSSGYSLNDMLCVGPAVQDELLDIILRFRTYKVTVVGDIAKMYRQILLHPDDRSYVRICFRFTPHSPIQYYELNTVTYGLSPSSFLATRTLQQLADDEGTAHPVAADALKNNFYVDDFIGGADSIESARHLRLELSKLLSKGGFELRKWTSNRLEVLTGLASDQIGTQSALQFMPDETIKALGISWEPEHDVLSFPSAIYTDTTCTTKRTILSSIARMFDPLGLVAPIVVRSKIMMQELWLQKAGWDDPVPDSICKKWKDIQHDWPLLSSFKIDRYALLPGSRLQLHTFCDASEAAYGACIYVRCEGAQGRVHITLLASKSRVAPLKRVTLPRLELCAAVLGAHLYDRVKKAMGLTAAESYFWSDSTVTLKWIGGSPNTWATFVANRVAEVQHYTHPRQWRHVPGSTNPADLVSRGMAAVDFLKSKLWSSGPEWLALSSSQWPDFCPEPDENSNLEIRKVSAAFTNYVTNHPWFTMCSSYTRLLRIIALCIRFTRNVKEKARTQQTSLRITTPLSITPEDTEAAKTVLCRLAQQDEFTTELKQLTKGEAIAKQSPLRRLNPFLDEQGILRVGGRLKLSQLPYQSQHPIVLPKNHKFGELIAAYHHEKLMHGGGRLLLSQIRETYWPLDGRHLVKRIVRNCFRCIRQEPRLEEQQVGQLPPPRVTPSRPFSVTGVDYAGPFYLKPAHRRAAAAKSYLCVFVCFATKAVHLELVGDLTTAGFLAALRRFTSRRGLPAHIHSDNGKNFEGAAHELRELFRMFRDEQQQHIIANECANKGITWHFTPPKAPHFGGLWEAAVKTAKRHLYRHLGSTRLSYEGYSTILQQIEAAMNSRPLLPTSDDPNDLAALTPAHFLIGTSMHSVPTPDYTGLKMCTLDELQKWQLMFQRFWKHWTSEYLQELQKDNMRHHRTNDILPGRLVILMDESLPTTRWPLARIIDVHPGQDQLTRVVKLKTAKGILTRPITKICILPLAADPNTTC
ncbi:uncharacterized protein LOC128309298 [Anopheles moucheti]|uniref:uncharacterized protein LOC128309298 n=1 Tax=Anopheles moucheti TaxID=186751 RepID=UPI0022F0EAE1|nr:uncharacterized protein LOC128309298 [Anopheles moucheti]